MKYTENEIYLRYVKETKELTLSSSNPFIMENKKVLVTLGKDKIIIRRPGIDNNKKTYCLTPNWEMKTLRIIKETDYITGYLPIDEEESNEDQIVMYLEDLRPKIMKAKEVVKETHPEATIKRKKNNYYVMDIEKRIIGTGPTEAQAWINTLNTILKDE